MRTDHGGVFSFLLHLEHSTYIKQNGKGRRKFISLSSHLTTVSFAMLFGIPSLNELRARESRECPESAHVHSALSTKKSDKRNSGQMSPQGRILNVPNSQEGL